MSSISSIYTDLIVCCKSIPVNKIKTQLSPIIFFPYYVYNTGFFDRKTLSNISKY